MASKNDENREESPSYLVFILAIAGRIDAQGRSLASQLEKGRGIYYSYAALDSLSSSYSMFKYVLDVCVPNNNADLMHDIMLSPAGIAAVATETIFLVGFSLLACHFENEKKDAVKKFISAAWPYFRDVFKALKNAYKGWRSAIQAMNIVGGADLNYLIVPVGLMLGIVAAINRLWLRSMVEARKVMMNDNAELLLKIKKLNSLNLEELDSYLSQIKYQDSRVRIQAYFAVAIGGFVDGLYLYVGVLSLASLSSPAFTAMAVMCAIYTVACVISRIYEEFDFQQRLFITQTKCKLALVTKQIETNYKQFHSLMTMMKLDEEDHNELEQLQFEVCQLINQFDETRKLLKEQTTRTYFTAGLLGIKSGLYAYGAMASVLFLLGSIMIMTSVTFPPGLLIACVSLGMIFMMGFFVHGLIMHHIHVNSKPEMDEHPYDMIGEMRQKLEQQNAAGNLLEPAELKASLRNGLVINPSPQFFFQEWFEVIRSFFSGIGKGQKFVDFAGVALQEADERGHYHDTPVMYVLAALDALLFAFVLALRALAKGLGRTPLGQESLVDAVTPEKPVVEKKDPINDAQFKSPVDDKPNLDIEMDELNRAEPQQGALQEFPRAGFWRSASIARPRSTNSFFPPSPSDSPSKKMPQSHSLEDLAQFNYWEPKYNSGFKLGSLYILN